MLLFDLILLIHVAAFSLPSAPWERRPTTPPDWIGYSYPTTDIVVNETFHLGIHGGAFDPHHDYYGLAYEINIFTASPDGQSTAQHVTGNMHRGSCSEKSFSFGNFFVSTVKPLQLGVAGTYTAFWNVTYGTSDDENVMNITACDTSKLSYQTWLFNVTFNVIDSPADSPSPPVHTFTRTTFSTKPTGTMFEKHAIEAAVPWAPLPGSQETPLRLPGA